MVTLPTVWLRARKWYGAVPVNPLGHGPKLLGGVGPNNAIVLVLQAAAK